MPTICRRLGNSRNYREIRGTECASLNGSKLSMSESAYRYPTPESVRSRGEVWLHIIGHAAVVEVTSEAQDYPVESAFGSGEARGWRAAAPGLQTIRLVFDRPQKLKYISLVFEENETTRTQEFVCGGPMMLEAHLEISCASRGISVRQEPMKSRIIG